MNPKAPFAWSGSNTNYAVQDVHGRLVAPEWIVEQLNRLLEVTDRQLTDATGYIMGYIPSYEHWVVREASNDKEFVKKYRIGGGRR